MDPVPTGIALDIIRAAARIDLVRAVRAAIGGGAIDVVIAITGGNRVRSIATPDDIMSQGVVNLIVVTAASKFVIPRENKAPLLKNHDEVVCEEPFNLQELARSGVGLVKRVDETVHKLNDAITRIDEVVLSQHTLTNLTSAVGNFRLVSERALSAVAGFDQVVQSNAMPVSLAVTNLGLFAQELNEVANGLSNLLDTNGAQLTSTIRNVESVSASVNVLVSNLNNGRGLAGFLIKDEEVKLQISLLMGNLTTLSSNLNKYGLLYKPKPVKTRTSTPPPYSGRQP